jgi:hypothetical protein
MLRVNAGIGALDPMQKLAKLKMATDMLIPMAPMMAAQGIKPKLEAFIEEVMGGAGFRDGRRFWEVGEAQEQGQDPELQKVMAELQMEREKLQASLREVILELRSEELRNREDNQTAILLEQMKGRREVIRDLAKGAIGASQAREGREHERSMARDGRVHEVGMAREGRMAERQGAREERTFDRQDARTTREADRADAREGRDHEARQALIEHIATITGKPPRAASASRSGSQGASPSVGRPGSAAGSPGRSNLPVPAGDGSRRQRVIDILSGRQPGGIGPVSGSPGGLVPQDEEMEPEASDGRDHHALLMQRMVQQMGVMSNAIAQSNAAVAKALDGFSRHLAAPVEVMRDPETGRVLGARRAAPAGEQAGGQPQANPRERRRAAAADRRASPLPGGTRDRTALQAGA